MSRRRNESLRPLSNDEREKLQHLVRCGSEPAEQVAHAKALLSVAEGSTYIEAARRAGRRSNDAVSQLVTRFNREGLGALVRCAGQGGKARYGPRERQRILAEVRRQPEPAADGTVAWSVMTLRRALREVPDGLSQVSGYTIHTVLREAGFRWLGNRSWCETGQAVRRRKSGSVPVTDVDAEAKKKID